MRKRFFISIVSIVLLCIVLSGCTPFAIDAPQGISIDEREFKKIQDERMYAEAADYKGYIYKEGERAMCFRMKSPETIEEGKTYPIIIFLHGKGDGGTDNSKHMYRSLIDSIAKYVKEDCFVMLPQAANDLDWTQVGGKNRDRGMSNLYNACLDAVLQQFPIDTSRLYLTGMSMGGNGTMYQAFTHPKKYAAVMALCGYYDGYVTDTEVLKDLPIWLSHSKNDKTVSSENSTRLYDQLIESGNSDVHLTMYEGDHHDITSLFYNQAQVWQWLMSK